MYDVLYPGTRLVRALEHVPLSSHRVRAPKGGRSKRCDAVLCDDVPCDAVDAVASHGTASYGFVRSSVHVTALAIYYPQAWCTSSYPIHLAKHSFFYCWLPPDNFRGSFSVLQFLSQRTAEQKFSRRPFPKSEFFRAS